MFDANGVFNSLILSNTCKDLISLISWPVWGHHLIFILFYVIQIYHKIFLISDCKSSELIQLSIRFQSLLFFLEMNLNLDSFHFSHEKAHEVCKPDRSCCWWEVFEKQAEPVRMIISLWVFFWLYCFQEPHKRIKVAAFLFTLSEKVVTTSKVKRQFCWVKVSLCEKMLVPW